MTAASKSVVDLSHRIETDPEHVDERSTFSENEEQTSPSLTYPERLRHVFPRSSRRSVHSIGGNGPRVTKSDHHRSAFLYRRQLRTRGTFHRMIDSFFGYQTQRRPHRASPQDQSRASSSGSRLEVSARGSVPSLDFISPGLFLFSGPCLRSAGSRSSSTSKFKGLSGSCLGASVPRNRYSDSYSLVDHTSLEEKMLDPNVGAGVVRSLSDVLLGISTPSDELGDPLFQDPKENITLMNRSHLEGQSASNQALWLRGPSKADILFQNHVTTAIILHYSDTETWRTLRLVCHSWCKTVNGIAPPTSRSASRRLPVEILLTIYGYLPAKDFNACRRTCRSWMLASLDINLLNVMLYRGGWHSGIPAKDDGILQQYATATIGEEWRLSRYLSRQCAMAAHWTGNGLDDRPAIAESAMIDFTDLGGGYCPHRGRNGGTLIFTASICGQYLLVANETLIYIYSLMNRSLEPISCVVCPRRVLAMSMNASVGRDAIAVLLEGRMGMLCELQPHHTSSRPACRDSRIGRARYLAPPIGQPNSLTRRTSGLQERVASAENTSSQIPPNFPEIRNMKPEPFDAIELQSPSHAFDLRDTDDISTHTRNSINHAWNLTLRGPIRHLKTTSKLRSPGQSIPIESGTSTFYRHLCAEDDPPRNVSICPQRRCVAFGCSAGIELHWIDALTRQSLSRWFPLTSPSDHLYFLSPRPGFESAKKLRLISSAAHPSERPAISRKSFSSASISSIWGSLGFESRSRQSPTCDHYRAIPLSDGHHVLFIDPSTERLTLGCDAPLGGPARLLRKIILNSPEGMDIPRVYTAAADMSSGARIVAVFNTVLMLYSIPPDVLALSRSEQVSESPDYYNSSRMSSGNRHHDHWLNWWNEPGNAALANKFDTDDDDRPTWPLSLCGTVIGTMPDVCELAIQTRPDVLIWAFTHTAQCKTWQLRNYAEPIVQSNHYVDQSGLVHESSELDESGGVIVQSTLFPSSDTSAGDAAEAEEDIVALDGHSSGVLNRIPGALSVEKDDSVDMIDVNGCADAWYEDGGDVMTWNEA